MIVSDMLVKDNFMSKFIWVILIFGVAIFLVVFNFCVIFIV